MMTQTDISQKITKTMTNALMELQQLVTDNPEQKLDIIGITKTFLLGVISTAIDLTEIKMPGATPLLYADIEASAKLGGLRAIKKVQSSHGNHYSVSNIAADDPVTAMNYLGQELGTTLFKSLNELPMPLRTSEMMLRAVEALLANLLSQKFNNSHEVLDSLCEHVHMCLRGLHASKN